MGLKRLEAEVRQFKKENQELRQYILALQSEVYGARLAAKYLDKELAGRLVKNILNLWWLIGESEVLESVSSHGQSITHYSL